MESVNSIALGTVVRVPILGGLFQHYGIISTKPFFGEPMVISGSARRGYVAEEPLSQFAQGGPVYVDGYPGVLAPDQVVMRARSAVGQRWNLLTSNCEHFVRLFHGLAPRSEQINQAVTAALSVLAVCALAKTSST